MQDTTQTTAQAAVATPAAAQAAATFMTVDQARDWAWNNVREYVGTEGWTVMDSVNFHGFFLYGWNYRGQYELQRTATRTAIIQEILSAAPAPSTPVVLPEPEAAVTEVMALVQDYFVTGTDGVRDAVQAKLRALLAGVSAPAAMNIQMPPVTPEQFSRDIAELTGDAQAAQGG